jgi:hypothetical protein
MLLSPAFWQVTFERDFFQGKGLVGRNDRYVAELRMSLWVDGNAQDEAIQQRDGLALIARVYIAMTVPVHSGLISLRNYKTDA